jgi:hypothetical protein
MADSTMRGGLLSTGNGKAQPEVSPMLQLLRGLRGRKVRCQREYELFLLQLKVKNPQHVDKELIFEPTLTP